MFGNENMQFSVFCGETSSNYFAKCLKPIQRAFNKMQSKLLFANDVAFHLKPVKFGNSSFQVVIQFAFDLFNWEIDFQLCFNSICFRCDGLGNL